ncbi:MAG: hypothetical protein GXO83_11905 [Chlorobi bacterium]|nr:hypothetical protein [Chlorobiota bacterium]
MLRKFFHDIYYFFPLQLLLEHLRRHYTIIFIWLLLFLYITGGLGFKYGVNILFLAPEYLNRVNFLSYFILGFTVGIFIMAFHITTYITSGYQFPVIFTFRRPFYRFALNNFLIPVGFTVTLLTLSVRFQVKSQLFDWIKVLIDSIAFLAGISLFYLITLGYFFTMNQGLRRIISLSEGKLGKWRFTGPLQKIMQQDQQWKLEMTPLHNVGRTHISLYLHTPFRIRRAPRRITLPVKEIIKIQHNNHTFAAVFSVTLVIGLLAVGVFISHPAFNIPAAASILLIFTLGLLLYTVFYIFFKDYSVWFLLILFFILSSLINHGIINRVGQAYGLNYNNTTTRPVKLKPAGPRQVQQDSLKMIRVLSRWEEKCTTNTGRKPVAVFIHTAGGGLKATLWTYYSLAVADSLSQGKLLAHTILITGASGGMIGAAYLRELQLRKVRGELPSLLQDSLFTMLSEDILNPVALHLALKDWFFTFQNFRYNGILYRKDRGWAFEERLNQNTGNILDHPLSYYIQPEKEALIPLMYISPTVLNDGKMLVISPLPASFMTSGKMIPEYKSFFEYKHSYAGFSPENLRFTSALRMNASYPVLSPVITLPGTPSLQLTDAGFRDNFGYLSELKFIHYFREWLQENTSGLVIIHISSTIKEPMPVSSAYDFLRPFQSVYHDYFTIQQMNGMMMHELAEDGIDVPVTFVPLNLDERKERISLSWHLTQREKIRIKASVDLPANRQSLKNLLLLLNKDFPGNKNKHISGKDE